MYKWNPLQYIPDDHSRQVTSAYYLDQVFGADPKIHRILDLGCGEGNSVEYFRRKDPAIRWVGLDILENAGFHPPARSDVTYTAFDGLHFPMQDGSIDLVFCDHVMQCVRYPDAWLTEIRRVLKPGGYFIGTVSHTEPYVGHVLHNFSPYGFEQYVTDAGLELVELRPGIDALTLMIRRGLRTPRLFNWFFTHESPLHRFIGLGGRLLGRPHTWINDLKLLFCGHLCFKVRKAQ